MNVAQSGGTMQLRSFVVVCCATKANKSYIVKAKNDFQGNTYIISSLELSLHLIKYCNSNT